jgi:hypothetical protein
VAKLEGMNSKGYENIDTATLGWRKSTRSNGGGGNCVEVAELADGGRAVRDSKNPDGPVLLFTAGEWLAFTGGVKDGEFDL